ncbi:uncharacterized protein LOC128201041 [Galleria mellonella]|uniref:Uncharacterized protein LOC128201041 n=1 Tax=Galleria mellonella TaxID=7137 RepID=A0ABM3MM81_GALME|nr:uncharacterized protein LOC128201041 [Galleria mellonella]
MHAMHDPNDCAIAVSEAIIEGMKLFIPNPLVAMGSKKRPWFNRSYKKARFAQQAAYRTWTTARTNSNPGITDAKRKLNAAAKITITQCKVRRELLSLDVHKSSGPDGIPAVVLKQCAPELCPVLTRLFTISYSTGQFPLTWKTTLLHPVPKKGDKSDPSNYRPIAIASLLSKVMERIINAQLLKYLEDHDLLSDRQYGFRHSCSTGDLLVQGGPKVLRKVKFELNENVARERCRESGGSNFGFWEFSRDGAFHRSGPCVLCARVLSKQRFGNRCEA